VTPELTTLDETAETGSTHSSVTAIKVAPLPAAACNSSVTAAIKVAPLPAAACNGPKKLGGWGRLKAKTAAEDPPDPPPPPTSHSSATYSSSSAASVSLGTLAPVGEPHPLRESPVRTVPQICLRTEEDDGVDTGVDVKAAAPVVPVSEGEEAGDVVPERVAVGTAVVPGSTGRGGHSLVDPSEMLASLQQFKVEQMHNRLFTNSIDIKLITCRTVSECH